MNILTLTLKTASRAGYLYYNKSKEYSTIYTARAMKEAVKDAIDKSRDHVFFGYSNSHPDIINFSRRCGKLIDYDCEKGEATIQLEVPPLLIDNHENCIESARVINIATEPEKYRLGLSMITKKDKVPYRDDVRELRNIVINEFVIISANTAGINIPNRNKFTIGVDFGYMRDAVRAECVRLGIHKELALMDFPARYVECAISKYMDIPVDRRVARYVVNETTSYEIGYIMTYEFHVYGSIFHIELMTDTSRWILDRIHMKERTEIMNDIRLNPDHYEMCADIVICDNPNKLVKDINPHVVDDVFTIRKTQAVLDAENDEKEAKQKEKQPENVTQEAVSTEDDNSNKNNEDDNNLSEDNKLAKEFLKAFIKNHKAINAYINSIISDENEKGDDK